MKIYFCYFILNYDVTWGATFKICFLEQLLPRQDNANDLMSQTDKTTDCVSDPLYHVDKIFHYLLSSVHSIYIGYKGSGKVNAGDFSHH